MIDLQKFKMLVDLLTYFQSEQVCRDYNDITIQTTYFKWHRNYNHIYPNY